MPNLLLPVRLGTIEDGRRNNLNLIRFALASAVVYSHSYGALLGGVGSDPVTTWLGFNDIGSTAVFAFFFLSGYLVVKSALRRNDPAQFITARALRIFPGLVAVTIGSVFVLGPLLSNCTLRDYFGSRFTWAYLGEIVLHRVQQPLPGVFAQNPHPLVVNGPLWTLPVEWLMYILTLLGAMALSWRRLPTLGARAWLAIAGALLLTAQMLPALPQLPLVRIWGMYFLAGTLCYLLRAWIVLWLPLALGLFVADIAMIHSQSAGLIGRHLFWLSLCYLIVVLGFHPAAHLRFFHRFGDYSYGLYIYAWPVQQILAPHMHDSLEFFAAAYLPSLLLAMLSWRYIEEPCLRKKRRMETDRQAKPTWRYSRVAAPV